MDAREVLELVDKEIVIDILSELGSPCSGEGVTSQGVNYLKFQTVCHGGDSPDKLWWYENSKTFQCWTCCGKLSLFDLIMRVNECSFKESLYYVAQKVGYSFTDDTRIGFQNPETVKEIRSEISKMEKTLESKKTKSQIQNITKFYDPTILNYYDKNVCYQGWIDEGITEETMDKFDIRFYWEGHIIIPHYDIDGNLIGIRRRSLNPEDSKNKYMPAYLKEQFFDHPLGLSLYGIYQNQNAIRKKKAAILVEGEKSVMLSDSFYKDNSIALATCGFNISDWQIRMLKTLGVQKLYIGFDKDFDLNKEYLYEKDEKIYRQYKRYCERLESLGQRTSMFFNTYMMYDKRSLLGPKDSPMDRGKEVLEKLIADARLVK